MGMNTYLTRDNPCTRDCPEREPGCNCERRIAWQKVKEERKEKIRKHRENQSALDELAIGRRKG